jgi:glycogen debranching enzyme
MRGATTHHAVRSGCLWFALTLVALPARGEDVSVGRWPIAPSRLALKGDVRPGQYLGVVGRRAAWLGTEAGEGEVWIHPLKVASRLRLAFRIPDYADAVRGADVARTVETGPEMASITYSHATFTVQQHILVPDDEPGLLLLLDVESVRPLEIIVSFESVMQLAWPGALGGQYVFWSASDRAFVLSESLRRYNAVVGSPWASAGSEHPAHALPDAPCTMVIPVDAARARRELIPVSVAAGIEPREKVLATQRRLIGKARELYESRRSRIEAVLAATARIDSPDDRFDLAFAWAKVNLAQQVVCNPDLGCGLVAGWGASGRGFRPGFGWFFGGDAAINSLAMDAAGMWDDAAQGLRFLAAFQRADGKIPHEISQAAGRLAWFQDYPYAFLHADTTPFWLVALGRYVRASGDLGLLQQLWPNAKRAFAWCLTTETDGDGIVENTTGGLGAIEVGDIGRDIHQDVYLAAVWVEALRAMAELATLEGESRLAADARALEAKARASLGSRYWIEAAGHHAFGVLRSGATNPTLTVWPATAGAFGLLEPSQADKTLRRLASHEITTDWGARLLTARSPLYGPLEYNMGAVWPFMTGFLSQAHFAYRRPWSAWPLLEALAGMTFDWARGRHPELLSGHFYRPLDTAVPHQLFASSMLVYPAMSGLLGWEADAPNRRARLAPQIPPSWTHVSVEGLRVGQTTLSARVDRKDQGTTVRVTKIGPPIELDLSLGVPIGARSVSARLDGRPVVAARREGLHDSTIEIRGRLEGRPLVAEVLWEGGLELALPPVDLEPGQTDGGIRVMDFRAERGGWTLDLEGRTGREYALELHGARIGSARGGEVIASSPGTQRLIVRIPDAPDGFGAVSVHLER